MKSALKIVAILSTVICLVQPVKASDLPDGAKIFSQKCKTCHALDKKKIGVSVQSMSEDVDILRAVITDGKKRMPKFGHKLSDEQIDALVMYIQSQKI